MTMTSVDVSQNLRLKQKAIELTQKLVRYPSITPDDAGSFDFLSGHLISLGFNCQEITRHGVRNLIASRYFGDGDTLAFAGHLDVVPPGDHELWLSPPFAAEIINGRLYGRGVADMKGAIACFLAAIEILLAKCSRGTLMLLITCDEEGEAEHGTASIVDHLQKMGLDNLPDYCLVGEPSCKKKLGDTIKIGRRGSLSSRIRIFGQQGHVAYPNDCKNAAHSAIDIAAQLLKLSWDKGLNQMPSTSLQITQLNSGEFVDNVVPGVTDICFNIRYSSHYSEENLQNIIRNVLDSFNIRYEIDWQRPCSPYFNLAESFVDIASNAVTKTVGLTPILTCDGGTSDGRFIASNRTQVIELGLKNENIHQVNESAALSDIGDLAHIYQMIIHDFCVDSSKIKFKAEQMLPMNVECS